MQTDSGDVLIKALNTVRIEAKKIETSSDTDTEMTVGANFTMPASANMTMKCSAQGDIEATGTLTIKGAMVNIN
jgi:hypothetical protein